MDFSVPIFVALAVVLILFIFACSIANVIHDLPNCQSSTILAIEHIVLQLGCFINFKQNIEMLRKNMDLLNNRIQELRRGRSDEEAAPLIWTMVPVQEEAVQLMDEVRRVINNHRMWSSTCYQLSYRVAEMILMINNILEPQESLKSLEQYKSYGIPGIVVVVLIAYSLTNAILHFPMSCTTATSDAIDWIVVEMHYPFQLERPYEMLRHSISLLKLFMPIEKIQGNETQKRKVDLLEEGERLSSEAEDMLKHWYTGWRGSRYRLANRVESLVFNINKELGLGAEADIGYGIVARNVISHIDAVSNILPAAVTNIRHYLEFNINITKLRHGILGLQPLIRGYHTNLYNHEEKPERLVTLEAAELEAVQLLKEAQGMDRFKHKRFRASRYKLSKRLVKLLARIEVLTAPPQHMVLTENLRVKH